MSYQYKWEDICAWTAIPYQAHGGYQVPCPYCARMEKKHKMYVDPDNRVFNCFKCGSHGGVVDLYALTFDLSFNEAKEEMKERVLGSRTFSKVAPATKPELKVIDEITQSRTLPMEYRDKVYRAMLESLTLTESDRAYLRSKGLSDKAIDGLMFRSLPVGSIARNRLVFELNRKGFENLLGIPGFYEKDGKVKFVPFEHGILIPVLSADKKIQTFQIRSTSKEVAKDKRYYALSSAKFEKGCKSETFVHCVIPNKDITAAYLTEGCLKADIAAVKSGRPFLAILGVNCQKHLEKCIRQFQNLRQVYIAFDMDKFENPNVSAAQEQLCQLLKKCGITPIIVNWDRDYKGIDDFLVAKKKKDGEA